MNSRNSSIKNPFGNLHEINVWLQRFSSIRRLGRNSASGPSTNTEIDAFDELARSVAREIVVFNEFGSTSVSDRCFIGNSEP